MKATPTELPEVLMLEPRVHSDERGHFFESWNASRFAEITGVGVSFVQDNHSSSAAGVLRGIHYQVVRPQGKLVRVVLGRIFDVAVDLRRSSARFGKWVGTELSAENKRQLWIPPGFGHAFLALSDPAEVVYKTTEYWLPEFDRCIAWNDPKLAICWPLSGVPILSERDASAPGLDDAEIFA